MGSGPGPRGQAVGIFECIAKSDYGDKVTVVFQSGTGNAVLHLDSEDADYFTVGQSYSFLATAP